MVKTGDKIKVTVIGVDRARGRISLSARSKPVFAGAVAAGGAAGAGAGVRGGIRSGDNRRRTSFAPPGSSGFSCNPFASL